MALFRFSPHRDRVPPGQHVVGRFPVLQAGVVQHPDRKQWRLVIDGLIEPHLTFAFADLLALPATELICDIHCVTSWSKLDTHWKGVRVKDLLEGATIPPEAQQVLVYGEQAWTTNLPVEELLRDEVLVAYEYEGAPLSDEHGGPVRLVVPRLYFWKSAKWMTRIELLAEKRLGYWESVGYHELGDPWLEQRYAR